MFSCCRLEDESHAIKALTFNTLDHSSDQDESTVDGSRLRQFVAVDQFFNLYFFSVCVINLAFISPDIDEAFKEGIREPIRNSTRVVEVML